MNVIKVNGTVGEFDTPASLQSLLTLSPATPYLRPEMLVGEAAAAPSGSLTSTSELLPV